MSQHPSSSQPPQRRGLGRGLGSLIPTGPARTGPASESPSTATPAEDVPADGVADGAGDGAGDGGSPAPADPASADAAPELVGGSYYTELPPASITPNRVQPRQVFDEESMAELVASLREVGLLQPVVVRPSGGGSFELVMGERRWRAARQAGLERIPAIVRQTGDDDMLRDALLENLHRSQLNPLEEAAAYGQLLEDFGCTHDELATRIGRSRPQISNTLRLLKLSPAVQRRVAAGVLSAGHARSLLAVADPEIQDRLAARVVSEGISVRGLEEIVAVGETGGAAPVARRTRPVAPGLAEIADRLSERFETRVRVQLGKSKGKVTVEFASLEDLRRIVEVMDPRNRTDRPI